MRLALAIACAFSLLGACDRRAPITSCESDLTGEYASGDQHWMVLDRGASLEAFPLFPDVPAVAGLEVAPRAIELARRGAQITGELRRRYMKAMAMCTAKVPVRITACTNESLEIALADPTPPLAFAPCQWSRAEPNRRERWMRR